MSMYVSMCGQMDLCVLTHVEPVVPVRKLPQFLPTLLFGDRRRELGACPLARLRPRDPPVSASCVLALQSYATAFYLDAGGLNSEPHACSKQFAD